MTDDLAQVPDADELEEGEVADIADELPPPNILGDDEEEVDDDAAIISEGFTAEGATEGEGEEFDPENPDDYLYKAPVVKYDDSSEEGVADWVQEEEF